MVPFGTHICSIYRDTSQQFLPLSSLISEGLMNNQSFMYIFHENTPDDVNKEINGTGFGTHPYLSSHQLLLCSSEETYLHGGSFSVDNALSLFTEKINEAVLKGYDGLSIMGEMSWAADRGISDQDILGYEVKCDTVIPKNKVVGICQYNENKFKPEFLIDIIRCHPYVILYGKLYKNTYFYNSPEHVLTMRNVFRASDYPSVIDLIIYG